MLSSFCLEDVFTVKIKQVTIDVVRRSKLGLVADPVIKAIARLEFEDGLKMGVLPGGFWCPCGDCTYTGAKKYWHPYLTNTIEMRSL